MRPNKGIILFRAIFWKNLKPTAFTSMHPCFFILAHCYTFLGTSPPATLDHWNRVKRADCVSHIPCASACIVSISLSCRDSIDPVMIHGVPGSQKLHRMPLRDVIHTKYVSWYLWYTSYLALCVRLHDMRVHIKERDQSERLYHRGELCSKAQC